MSITPYEIIERFMSDHPNHVHRMKTADHNEGDMINPYHAEGDVFTHTMMVFNQAVRTYPRNNIIQLAALLHDIGKPYCRNVRTLDSGETRVSFHGHEGIGFYLALDVLQKTYSDVLTNDEDVLIATLVAYHSNLYSHGNKKSDEFVKHLPSNLHFHLTALVNCDSRGRICNDRLGEVNYAEEYSSVCSELPTIKYDAPFLRILVGPPASGKSTYVEEKCGNDTIVSFDNEIMKLGNGDSYEECWKTADKDQATTNINHQFQRALNDRSGITIDMTNMTIKSRRRWIKPATKAGYNIVVVVFCTPYSEIYRRAELRDKHIPTDVIDRMMKSFSFPSIDEGVDDVFLQRP